VTDVEDEELPEPAEGEEGNVIFAMGKWRTNAEMIRDAVVPLRHLRPEWSTVDPCWGLGLMWTLWEPEVMYGYDLDPAKSPTGLSVDACNVPHDDHSVDVAFLDGPYKLNGRPDVPVDSRYGVHEWATREGRHQLLRNIVTDGCRYARHRVLVKAQDQTNGGRVRWQTEMLTEHARDLGWEKVESWLFPSYRAQARRATCLVCDRKLMRRKDGVWRTNTRKTAPTASCVPDGPLHNPGPDEQDHARRNYSTLMAFAPAKGRRA